MGICPGVLERFVYKRCAQCSQHGNRHSTHNQQIREDNRSGCSGGVPSILARLTVSWCLVNPSRVWSDGWLCQLPNRTIAHGQPRGGRARSSARAQKCAHNVFAGARALQPVAQWATLPDYLLFFNPDLISSREGGWETIC